MKKKLVYVLFACLAMVNMALGQQKESRLALNPEVPVAGQSLELTYNPKGGPLEGRSDLVGIVYMYNFYHSLTDYLPYTLLSHYSDLLSMSEHSHILSDKLPWLSRCRKIVLLSLLNSSPRSPYNRIQRIIITITGLCLSPKIVRVIICRVDTLLGGYSGCLRWDRRPGIIFPGTTRRFLTRLR